MSLYEDLSSIVGEQRVSDSKLDLICYGHDLAPLPDELLKGFGGVTPDVVVIPDDIFQVSKIMEYAYHRDIPVTPRGGGSWGLGGILPTEGGIVLDLAGIDRILELNPVDEYVTLETGVEWKRLSDMLQRRGFQVGSCPTSAPVATIGGYISTGGSSGIGVCQYGPVGEQIISLEVVLSDGTIVQTNPWDSWTFAGSEGTLGLICRITLKIFKEKKLKHMLFGYDRLDAAVDAIIKLSGIKPYFFTFMDTNFIRLLNKNGGHYPEKEILLAVTIEINEGSEHEEENTVSAICRGDRLSDKMAEEKWVNRYKVSLSFKRLGPTLLSQEIRLPAELLGPALREWKNLLKNERYAFKGTCSDNGAINVVPVILTDETRKAIFFKSLSYTHEMAKIGRKYHGSVYGIGLFNANQMHRIHGPSLYAMKAVKSVLDPKGILNLYKTVGHRIPTFLLNFSFLLMRYSPLSFSILIRGIKYIPSGLIKTVLRVLMRGK